MEAAAGYKRTITAADPAAAARGAGSLLAAVAAGDEAKSLEARELMVALQGRPIMSSRSPIHHHQATTPRLWRRR